VSFGPITSCMRPAAYSPYGVLWGAWPRRSRRLRPPKDLARRLRTPNARRQRPSRVICRGRGQNCGLDTSPEEPSHAKFKVDGSRRLCRPGRGKFRPPLLIVQCFAGAPSAHVDDTPASGSGRPRQIVNPRQPRGLGGDPHTWGAPPKTPPRGRLARLPGPTGPERRVRPPSRSGRQLRKGERAGTRRAVPPGGRGTRPRSW